jgi:glutathione-regulated potassium-efflux system ancillary protein KefF
MAAFKATILFSHPYPRRSRAGRRLLSEVSDLPFVSVRSLYDLYPDFAVDVEAEQRALLETDLVVWQSPFYWYGAPALLSLWFEKVLTRGWAYGTGGTQVRGKRVLWVTTTGAPLGAYREGAMHGHPFEAFVPAMQQTATFCGMRWEPPLVLHGAHLGDDGVLRSFAERYRARLQTLAAEAFRG